MPARSRDRHAAAASAPRITSPISDYLTELHGQLVGVKRGAVADYIPELARADPNRFGIALATVDGELYETGDTREPFTIQSISKPLVHGLALESLGDRRVRSVIGVEPSGEPFNSIELDRRGRPPNPLVNSGAIAATSLIAAGGGRDPLQRIVDLVSAYTGRTLEIDAATARSESATGDRNRAIAHLLKGSGVLAGDPTEVVERYFQQCSIALDCRDAALMAATLANGGLHPLTGERVAGYQTVKSVLLVMATCGMYDGAGDWMYTVGLPAKSGVSGTIIAVLPGQLGIAVHSPPLDAKGNSVRGVEVCRTMSADLELHVIRPGAAEPAVRRWVTLADGHSKRVRSESELDALAKLGDQGLVARLQSTLSFSACEQVTRLVLDHSDELRFAILDLRRVGHISDAAVRCLAQLAENLDGAGGELILSGVGRHRAVIKRLARRASVRIQTFEELDEAMEQCEDSLLDAAGELEEPRRIAFADHALFAGIDPESTRRIRPQFERRGYPAGARIVSPGDAGETIYLVTRGRLSVLAELPDGSLRTLATLVPGMLFGELAFIERRPNHGVVDADTAVECYAIKRAQVDGLRERSPDAQLAIMANLARILASRTEAMRQELASASEA